MPITQTTQQSEVERSKQIEAALKRGEEYTKQQQQKQAEQTAANLPQSTKDAISKALETQTTVRSGNYYYSKTSSGGSSSSKPADVMTGQSVQTNPQQEFQQVIKQEQQKIPYSSQNVQTGISINPYSYQETQQAIQQKQAQTQKQQQLQVNYQRPTNPSETISKRPGIFTLNPAIYVSQKSEANNIKLYGGIYLAESKRIYSEFNMNPKEALVYGGEIAGKTYKLASSTALDILPVKYNEYNVNEYRGLTVKEKLKLSIPEFKLSGKETVPPLVASGVALFTQPKETLKQTYKSVTTKEGFSEAASQAIVFAPLDIPISKVSTAATKASRPFTIPIKNEVLKIEAGVRGKIQTGVNFEPLGLTKSYSIAGQKYLPDSYQRYLSKEEVALAQYRGINQVSGMSDFSAGKNVNKELFQIAQKEQTFVSVHLSTGLDAKKITKAGGLQIQEATIIGDAGVGGIRRKADLINFYGSVPQLKEVNIASSKTQLAYGKSQGYTGYIFNEQSYSSEITGKNKRPVALLEYGKFQNPKEIPNLTDKQLTKLLPNQPELVNELKQSPLKKSSFETNVFGKREKFQISPENRGLKEFTSRERQKTTLYGGFSQLTPTTTGKRFYTLFEKSTEGVYPKFLREGINLPKKIGGGKIEFTAIPKQELVKVDVLFSKPTALPKKVTENTLKVINQKESKKAVKYAKVTPEQFSQTSSVNYSAKYPAVSLKSAKYISSVSKSSKSLSSKSFNLFSSSSIKSSSKKSSMPFSSPKSSKSEVIFSKSSISSSFSSKPSIRSSLSSSSSSSKYSSISKGYSSKSSILLPKSSKKEISNSKPSGSSKTNKLFKSNKIFKSSKQKESKIYVLPDLISAAKTEFQTGKKAKTPILVGKAKEAAYKAFRGESKGFIPTYQMQKRGKK